MLSVLDIVTSVPPEIGLTAIILSVLRLSAEPVSVEVLYTQVLPTATGNGTELAETTDFGPLEPDPDPEPVLVPKDLPGYRWLLDEQVSWISAAAGISSATA